MKIAVLGAGHGGIAMAADLSLSGHEVTLSAVEEHSANIKLLKHLNGIHVEGVTSLPAPAPQLARPKAITEDVCSAIREAEIIMVIVPAFGQKVYMDLILQHGQRGQIVCFPCGGFAALEFYRKMKECRREHDFIATETSSFIYTTKISGPGKILIKSIKDKVYFAALPAGKTDEALQKLHTIYPQYTQVSSIWQTSFSNPSALLHTIPTLLNMSRIELMGPYRYSHYDITPSIGRIMQCVDEERMEIARQLFPNPPTFLETMCTIYNLKCETIYEAIKSIKAYNVQFSPDSIRHRYVSEDIPYSLVPIATIGHTLGIATPNMDSIINIACMANDEDYWSTGRTAEKIGLELLMPQKRQITLQPINAL